ncbi:hypothetical protein [Flammeovirga kamogawensis]|uniref:Uncharacterized protein n=1 Tax=Flammeovirga kamogawensis TaxID=373891 RepID=A0ABX8H2E6_9BACT|nr:hypothetical protein [Flammeovirga kamogawensis]MBB6463283.1 hypothetical protein [Flammeovirga kamogawensis]QWG09567.1 hypothetical protein KM029_23450 [Flammeovirga kamogawensis]TRX65081.1 hypothetical protein EO216_21345 [Flammeovirga kamogawensis]
MKNIITYSSILLILACFNQAIGQVKVFKVPGSDSTIVINITEIRENAMRVAEEARKVAAEVQVEEMEGYIKIIMDAQEEVCNNIEVHIDQETIEENIRIAEEQIRIHQDEIERAQREAERSINQYNLLSSFSLDYKGDIQISEDEDQIIGMSKDARFKIEKSTFGNKRKLVITPNGEGGLTYKYYEGNKEIPYNPDGKSWFEDILPEVIQSNPIAVNSRIANAMKEGLANTLDYIEDLNGDNNRLTFYKNLISRKDIKEHDLDKITRDVTRNTSSSYELGNYFSSTFAIYNNKKGLKAYFLGVSEINSSYEKAGCLRDIVKSTDFSKKMTEQQWEQWLSATESISSAYDKSTTLQIAFDQNVTKMPAIALESCLASISSDFEKRGSLSAAFSSPNGNNWSTAQTNALLMSIKSISSAFEKRSALSKSANYWNNWESSSQILYLQICISISSSFEKSAALKEIALKSMQNEDVINTFYHAASTISSSYDLSSFLKGSRESSFFTSDYLVPYLNASKKISSSFDTANALTAVAKDVARSKDQSLISLYKEVSESISSDFEREKALKALSKWD